MSTARKFKKKPTEEIELNYFLRCAPAGPVQPISEFEARERHSSRKDYAVTLKRPGYPGPYCFTDFQFAANRIRVVFLDNQKRKYVIYEFEIIESERIFLSCAIFCKFFRDTWHLIEKDRRTFKQDGTYSIEISRFRNGATLDSQDRKGKAKDLKDLFDVIPCFGEYQRITRFFRILPEVHDTNPS